MQHLGLRARGPCLICDRPLVAKRGKHFEVVVAVAEENCDRAKTLGFVCKKCTELSTDVKAKAVKARFLGATKNQIN
jgi:hypothetical protein